MAALPVKPSDTHLEPSSNDVSSAERGSLVGHHAQGRRQAQASDVDMRTQQHNAGQRITSSASDMTAQVPNSGQGPRNDAYQAQQSPQPRQSSSRPLGDTAQQAHPEVGRRHDQGTRTVAANADADNQLSHSMQAPAHRATPTQGTALSPPAGVSNTASRSPPQSRAAAVSRTTTAHPGEVGSARRWPYAPGAGGPADDHTGAHVAAQPPPSSFCGGSSAATPADGNTPDATRTTTEHVADVGSARPLPYAPRAAGPAVDHMGAHVAAPLSSDFYGGSSAATATGWNTPDASLTSLPGADSFNSISDSDDLSSSTPPSGPAAHSRPFPATLPYSVGSRANCRHGSGPEASHPFEDRTVCEINSADPAGRVQLVVGIFDGHDGARCVDFVSKPLVAEVAQAITRCIGDKTTILENARAAICEQHFRRWDERFIKEMCLPAQRQREELLDTLPPGLNSWQLYQQYPAAADTLGQLAEQLAGGCTGSVAFIVDEKLTVANVGDSRVLLCELQAGSVRACRQLSQDHDVNNPDEQRRLEALSLDVDSFVKAGRLGPVENTRSFGDFSVKTGWRDVDVLSTAIDEPVIAVPHIGHTDLPDQWLLLLMSDGVYKAIDELAEARVVMSEQPAWLPRSGKVDANLVVAQLVCDKAAQVGSNRLQAVADSVLEIISQWHQMAWGAAQALGERSACRKLDDLSLACFWAA